MGSSRKWGGDGRFFVKFRRRPVEKFRARKREIRWGGSKDHHMLWSSPSGFLENTVWDLHVLAVEDEERFRMSERAVLK